MSIAFSCTRIESIDSELVLKSSDKPKLIYMSDLNYKSDSLYQVFETISKRNINYYFYRCDCGDVQNYPIVYSHDIKVLPTVVRISEDCTTSDVLPNDLFFSQWLSSDIESDEKMKRLKFHYLLDNYTGCDSNINNITFKLSDFYSYYLKSRFEFLSGNVDSSTFYVNKAVRCFENSPDASKILLFRELLASYESEFPIVVFDSLSVNFGTIPVPGRYERVLKYKNYSSQPVLILSVVTSCPCLEVACDKIVEPYSEGEMNVVYNAEENPKGLDIQRDIHLITNTCIDGITIKVNAKY